MFVVADSGRWGYVAGFEGDGLVHAFSTRLGGVSEGAYSSLNTGLYSGDDPARVVANRELLFRDLGWRLDQAVCGRQVHGNRWARVDRRHRGAGARDRASAIPHVDGLLTDEPEVVLTVMGADCPSVFLFDPRRRAVGIVHAGWRGVVGGAAPAAVRGLREQFGSEPGDLMAAIGPSIGPCCYEVGDDVAAAFRDASLGLALKEGDAAPWRVDLAGALRQQLQEAGLQGEKVFTADMCTHCHPELFFSYRRAKGPVGSMMGIIALRQR